MQALVTAKEGKFSFHKIAAVSETLLILALESQSYSCFIQE